MAAHSTRPYLAKPWPVLTDKALPINTVYRVRALMSRAVFVTLAAVMLCALFGVLSVTLFYYFAGNPDAYLGTVKNSSMVDSADILGTPDAFVDLETHSLAQFVVTCSFVRALSVDPITLSEHEHAFFGNKEVGTGPASAVDNAMTSCAVPTDTASYWVPTLVNNNESMLPDRVIAYYRKGIGVTTADVNPYPPDFFMLAGPSTNSKVAFWKCTSASQGSSTIPDCDHGENLTMVVTFPDCWDGKNNDSVGHRNHVRYSSKGFCPKNHPKHIPQLIMKVVYNPGNYNSADYTLSLGGTLPHADFLNTWNQAELEKLVLTCLVRDQICPRH